MKKTAWENVLYWKLAATKCLGKALLGIILSMAQALNGLNWEDQKPTQKFIMIALALGQGWSIVDAFLDQTMSILSKNEKTAIARDTAPADAVVRTETITEVKS